MYALWYGGLCFVVLVVGGWKLGGWLRALAEEHCEAEDRMAGEGMGHDIITCGYFGILLGGPVAFHVVKRAVDWTAKGKLEPLYTCVFAAIVLISYTVNTWGAKDDVSPHTQARLEKDPMKHSKLGRWRRMSFPRAGKKVMVQQEVVRRFQDSAEEGRKSRTVADLAKDFAPPQESARAVLSAARDGVDAAKSAGKSLPPAQFSKEAQRALDTARKSLDKALRQFERIEGPHPAVAEAHSSSLAA